LSNPGKTATIHSVAFTIGKSFGKAFVKHNVEDVFPVIEIYPVNENIFVEDEFLSFCVTDRPSNRVTEPTSSSLVSKENSEGGISAGFVKVSAELIRSFPKDRLRKTGEKMHGKSKIQTDTQRILKLKTKEHKSFKENIKGKY
jgi:hypothetical protein